MIKRSNEERYLVHFALCSFAFFHCYFIMFNEASKSLLGFQGKWRLIFKCCGMLVYLSHIITLAPLMINDIIKVSYSSKCSVVFSAYIFIGI